MNTFITIVTIVISLLGFWLSANTFINTRKKSVKDFEEKRKQKK